MESKEYKLSAANSTPGGRLRGRVWSFRCPACGLVFHDAEAADLQLVLGQDGDRGYKACCPRCNAEATPLPPVYYN